MGLAALGLSRTQTNCEANHSLFLLLKGQWPILLWFRFVHFEGIKPPLKKNETQTIRDKARSPNPCSRPKTHGLAGFVKDSKPHPPKQPKQVKRQKLEDTQLQIAL